MTDARPAVLARLRARLRTRRPFWGLYPTGRLAAAVLVLGVLWLIPGHAGRTIGIVISGILIALVLGDAVLLPGARHIAVDRHAPDTLGLGDRAELAYRLRSAWPWPVRVQLFHALPAGIAAELDALAPRTVVRDQESTLVVPVTAEARGRHDLGDVALRMTTRLGLVARIVRRRPDDAIVVVPSLRNIRQFRLLAIRNRLSEAGVRALKQHGDGSAFGGLRDYVPGDDPRRIDWKATARHRQLITREQTIERSQTVITLVDCGRAMTQLAGRFPRFEHVLSSTLLLADVATTSGDRAGLIAFDDRIRAVVPPQRGTAALRAFRSALGALDATVTEPDYAAAFRLLATRQHRRAFVVLFTDMLDPRAARQFVAYAGRAARRHALVIVAIQNEAILAAASPGDAGSLALYRSAAAEELVREREEALARMRRSGVAVLDVPPERMAAAVINRYLALKQRGAV